MPTIQSPLLDTIIGLVLIFALVSLMATSIVEILNSFYKRRQTLLRATIQKMFDDGQNVNFGTLLYQHPFIISQKQNNDNLPQYLDPESFANALLDTVCEHGKTYRYNDESKTFEQTDVSTNTVDGFEKGIKKLSATPLQKSLLALVQRARETNPTSPLEALKQSIKTMFNNQMDRTVGWYKKDAAKLNRWVSFFLALFFNVNAFVLYTDLYNNKPLRDKTVAIAEKLVEENRKKALTDSTAIKVATYYQTQLDSLQEIGLPLGWSSKKTPLVDLRKILVKPDNNKEELSCIKNIRLKSFLLSTFVLFKEIGYSIGYLIGLLISALIIAFGAPIWFELLTKLVNFRKTGVVPKVNNQD